METSRDRKGNKDRQRAIDDYAKYTALGMQTVAIVALFVLGGIGLDRWLGTGNGLFTVIMSLLGCAGAVYYSVKDFVRINKKEDEE